VEAKDRSRRSFLRAALTVAAGGALLALHLSPRRKGGGDGGRILVRARAADVPEEGALVFRKEQVALLKEGGRVRALGLACTHLGCTVSVTATEIVCPCHGSAFDLSGKVLRGPADRPLPSLSLEERDGTFLVRAPGGTGLPGAARRPAGRGAA
jgi:Rieske Fe-S protein